MGGLSIADFCINWLVSGTWPLRLWPRDVILWSASEVFSPTTPAKWPQ